MNSVKCAAKYLSSCIGFLIIYGCVAVNPSEPDGPLVDNRAELVIAQDFVNLMMQIEKMSPPSTALRFGPEQGNPSEIDGRSIKTNNAFGKALRVVAANSGYVIETVDNTAAANYVSFSISEFGDAVDGTTYTYDVSVGEVDFRRVYKPLEGGGIEPFQSMLVRGVDVSQLETDDSIFTQSSVDITPLAQASANQSAAAVAVAKTDPQLKQPNAPILERPVTVAAPLISDLPEAGFEGSTSDSGSVAQSLMGDDLTTGFETIRKINIAVTGESNYENLLADKKDVVEKVLIFGDDSYVLGARNKQLLGQMIVEFNPDTDVVSVVGCSTGVTKIVNGNAALAIGRANRVKEALLYSGIPHDKIYDEGCWSPQANSTPFPNRGVVVTVKRKAVKG